jgi:hypothetical protein
MLVSNARRGALALVLLVAAGCESGQTGSPDCSGPRSCPCHDLRGRVLIRAELVGLGEDSGDVEASADLEASAALRLRVLEVLSSSGDTGLAANTEIESSRWGVGVPCEGQTRTLPKLGTEVFAAYLPGATGSVWVVPWHDPLKLGGDNSYPAQDVADLADPAMCESQFPPVVVECHDTGSADSRESCALSAPAAKPSPFRWVLPVIGWSLLRRRRLRCRAVLPGERR